MTDTITVRHPSFDFDGLPTNWVGDSRLGTCFGNAGHVFIPLGEEFFIDAVRRFRDEVVDPAQRKELNAFIGQESVHKRAHQKVWDTLSAQGVPVEDYARFITALRGLERYVPPVFQLSVTAALEHYTAAFGIAFLTEDLADAVPEEMARLLAWHGLEELEHRAVAFDVLQLVDDRYVTRAAGFAFATGLLVVVPLFGTIMNATRTPPAAPSTTPDGPSRGEVRAMTRRFLASLGRHVAEYLRPGFHPADLELPPEAETWTTRLAE